MLFCLDAKTKISIDQQTPSPAIYPSFFFRRRFSVLSLCDEFNELLVLIAEEREFLDFKVRR